MNSTDSSRRPLLVAALAAIGASSCCAGPLILLSLGISGSWIGNLSAMEPLRPWLMGATLIFLGLAFRKLYLQPQVCAIGSDCADPKVNKRQRVIFWLVSIVVVAVVAFPWYAEFVIDV